MKRIKELIQPEIAARVRARRETLGLTRKAVAERAGVSEQTCLRAEKPDAETSVAALASIAQVLGVPLDELLYGEPGLFEKPPKLKLLELIVSALDDFEAEQVLAFAEDFISARNRTPRGGDEEFESTRVEEKSSKS